MIGSDAKRPPPTWTLRSVSDARTLSGGDAGPTAEVLGILGIPRNSLESLGMSRDHYGVLGIMRNQ